VASHHCLSVANLSHCPAHETVRHRARRATTALRGGIVVVSWDVGTWAADRMFMSCSMVTQRNRGKSYAARFDRSSSW
jgi:hypothetical protein